MAESADGYVGFDDDELKFNWHQFHKHFETLIPIFLINYLLGSKVN